MSRDDVPRHIIKIESYIRRIGFPLFGIAGIFWEEFTDSDPLLIGAYLALAGLGVTPWVRDYFQKKDGDDK